MVNDVSNIKVRNGRNNMQRQNIEEMQNDGEKMVNAFTVLQWHEQRINIMEENIDNLSKKSGGEKNDIINSLVETIEALDKKLQLLSEGYDNLVEQSKKDKKELKLFKEKFNNKEDLSDNSEDEEGEEIKTQVKKELNTVKLNITEN